MACQLIDKELLKHQNKRAAYRAIGEELGVPWRTVQTWDLRGDSNEAPGKKRPITPKTVLKSLGRIQDQLTRLADSDKLAGTPELGYLILTADTILEFLNQTAEGEEEGQG
jgi:hypothetical protein